MMGKQNGGIPKNVRTPWGRGCCQKFYIPNKFDDTSVLHGGKIDPRSEDSENEDPEQVRVRNSTCSVEVNHGSIVARPIHGRVKIL